MSTEGGEKLEEQRLCEKEEVLHEQLDRNKKDLEVLKQPAEGQLLQTKEAKQIGWTSLGKTQPGFASTATRSSAGSRPPTLRPGRKSRRSGLG
jgi:hypothetical protein